MYIDLHNHILPGVDDGAVDIEDAVRMVSMAAESGTSVIAATPHRAWSARKECPKEWLLQRVAHLQKEIDQRKIPVTVIEGVELMMHSDIVDLLMDGFLPTLGGGNCILLEPPFDTLPGNMFALINQLSHCGFRILLAHPERCTEIQRDPAGFAHSFSLCGAFIQLTTGSLLGTFGEAARATAVYLLSQYPPTSLVIASDSHNQRVRPPNLIPQALTVASKFVGTKAANAMVTTIPYSLLNADPRMPTLSTLTKS